MGIVSHYKWVLLFERYRTLEWDEKFRELQKNELGLVLHSLELKYRAPAKFRDIVNFECEITEVKRVSFYARQVGRNDLGEIYVEGRMGFACIDKNLEPAAIPDYLKS